MQNQHFMDIANINYKQLITIKWVRKASSFLTNVVLGILSTCYKCSQKANKTSVKWSGYSEGQLHM